MMAPPLRHSISATNLQTEFSHELPNQEDGPIRCWRCLKEFTERKTLYRHVRSHCRFTDRSDGRPECEFCGKYFSRDDIMQRHVKEQHLLLGNPNRLSKLCRAASSVFYCVDLDENLDLTFLDGEDSITAPQIIPDEEKGYTNAVASPIVKNEQGAVEYVPENGIPSRGALSEPVSPSTLPSLDLDAPMITSTFDAPGFEIPQIMVTESKTICNGEGTDAMELHEPNRNYPEGTNEQMDIDRWIDDSYVQQDQTNSTISLDPSLLRSIWENGRCYHRYQTRAGHDWLLPEDEIEQDRLDLQHETWLYTSCDRLYKSPLKRDRIRRVLDVGTGTGIWAIDFADKHPRAQVIGTDISPIQPQFVPPNCMFEIDDLTDHWTFSQNFDFIHARALCAASNNWPGFIHQAYNNLNPGGWLEMSDMLLPIFDVDGSTKGTMIEEYSNRQLEGYAKLGLDGFAALKYKRWMIEQGFENVTEMQYKWPIGSWAKDPWQKYLGQLTQHSMLCGLEGFALRLWTRALDIPYAESITELARVRKDIANPKIHSYLQLYSVYGQKPDNV